MDSGMAYLRPMALDGIVEHIEDNTIVPIASIADSSHYCFIRTTIRVTGTAACRLTTHVSLLWCKVNLRKLNQTYVRTVTWSLECLF